MKLSFLIFPIYLTGKKGILKIINKKNEINMNYSI